MEKKQKLNFLRILLIISLIISILCITTTYAKYQEDYQTSYKIGIKRWMIKVNDIYINEKETISQVMHPTFVESEYINDGVIVPTSEGYFDINMDFSEVDLKFNFELDIGQADMLDFRIYGYEMTNKEEELDGEGIILFTEDDVIDGGIDLGTEEGSGEGAGTEGGGSGESGTEVATVSEETPQVAAEAGAESGAESGSDASGEGTSEGEEEEEVVEDTYTEGETDAKRIRQTIDPNTESIKKRFIRLYFEWYDGEGENFPNSSDAAFTKNKGEITYSAIMKFDQYVAP